MSRRKVISDERGYVLATAMAVLVITLTLGLVALKTVDFQTHTSGQETAGEAAFNLAESALDAETAQLGTQWPSTSATAWSAVCNQSTAPRVGCPGTSLTSSFSSTYAGKEYTNPQWTLQVFNNGWNPNNDYYTDALASGGANAQPNWDSNGDDRLWARAQATVGGQTRVVAAEVVRQQQVISLPRNTITAGATYTSNDGSKVIINGYDCVPTNTCGTGTTPTSGSGPTGEVALRCTIPAPYTGPSYNNGNPCAGWDPDKGQLSSPYVTGYTDTGGGYQTLQPAQLTALENSATATYNGSCPPEGATGVIVVENPPGGVCAYNSNTTWNTDSAPGMLLFVNGTLQFNATINFYGIIYMADEQGWPGPCTPSVVAHDGTVFDVHGNGTLYGALFVGNCGQVNAGSSAFNIQFDSNAFNGAVAYATPALAKNTFQLVAHP